MEYGRVPEKAHVEEATQTESGAPQPAMDRPTAVRQRVGCPAPTHLDDADFVTFLDQTMRGDAAAKAGTDHDEVEIELALVGSHAIY